MKEQIINAALEATGCTREDVFSPAKWEPLPLARYLIAWGLYGKVPDTYIADMIGRDRTTVIFGRHLISDVLSQPKHKFRPMVERFMVLAPMVKGKAKSGVLEFTSGELTAYYASGLLTIYSNNVLIRKLSMDNLTVGDVENILKSVEA